MQLRLLDCRNVYSTVHIALVDKLHNIIWCIWVVLRRCENFRLVTSFMVIVKSLAL